MRASCRSTVLCIAMTLAFTGGCSPEEISDDAVPELVVPAENVLRAAEDLATARRLIAAGGETDAEPLLRSVVDVDPKNADAHVLLGHVLRELGQHDEAVVVLRRAVEFAPRDPSPRHGLADSLDRLGQLGEAEATYRGWLEIEKGDADARFLLGTVLYRQGRFRDAVRELRQASKQRQSEAMWRSELGLALQALGKLDEAEAKQREATERDPRCATAWLRLGNLIYARDQARLSEAIDAMRTAVDLNGGDIHNHVYLYRLLSIAAEQGDDAARNAADAHFRRVLTLHSGRQLTGSRPAMRVTGRERDQAIRELRDQLVDEPSDAAKRTRLARLLHVRDDLSEALEHYDLLLAAETDPPADVLADAGAAFLLSGQRKRAVELLLAAVGKAPATTVPRRHLAWALLENGEVDAALDAYTSAREANPDDRLLALGQGLARMRAGELEAGLVQINKSGWLD